MYSKFLFILRKAWHSHVLFWGKNETLASQSRNCIVLAPHPDDESIGFGATIARKIQHGSKVRIAVATDGRYSQISEKIPVDELIELRKKEFIEAVTVLGVDKESIYFFDEEDTKINDHRLRENFRNYVSSAPFKVEEIISTSWNDSHQDHQACAKIAKDISLEMHITFRACPIYWWADGPTRFHRGQYPYFKRQLGKFLDLYRAFFNKGYVVSSKGYEDIRKLAVSKYLSQTTNLTGEESWSCLDKYWLSTFDRNKEYFIEQ
ncbi:MAG: PIG-L family deacetylase [Acidimicrobiia bacterium]